MQDNNKINDVLIDIRFAYSMNKFEEEYNDSVSYADLKQETYIQLKNQINELLNRKVKFRKYEHNGMVLTIRSEISKNEFELIKEKNEEGYFEFLYSFIISDVRLLNEEE